jgi:ubiquinone/menaquinone biosynthesis C-methylase UbiE
MKEIIANRRKIKLLQKLRLFSITLRENGFVWTTYLTIYYVTSRMADWAFTGMNERRVRHSLPGFNSVAMNYEIWQNWDWDDGGEEWTESVEWKNSLIKNILLKYMARGGRLLEIGPGAGRWTEVLQRVAGHLIAVDVSDRCIELCRKKFGGCDNLELFANDGVGLPFVDDDSIDSVWSFDVFVHINSAQVEGYVKELKRVLKHRACGVIHHGNDAGIHGGWRSNLTSERFTEILESHGFQVLERIAEWQDGGHFKVSNYGDVITIFQKPG